MILVQTKETSRIRVEGFIPFSKKDRSSDKRFFSSTEESCITRYAESTGFSLGQEIRLGRMEVVPASVTSKRSYSFEEKICPPGRAELSEKTSAP